MVDLNRILVLEPLREVVLDQLAAQETLVIETANSVYSFTLDSPQMRRGVLFGGSLARKPVTASLVVPREGTYLSYTAPRLRVGHCAIFCIELKGGSRRGITTAIRRLFRVRGVHGLVDFNQLVKGS
jgi:hypothetical protein